MDPIQINVNITLDASDKLAGLVQTLVGTRAQAPAVPATKPEPKKPETKPEPRKPETKEDPKPAEAPKPEPAPAPEPEPEQPETREVSDSELRVFIKSIRDKVGSNKAIWDVFAEFGIKTSIECPMERRVELMGRLEKLVA